MLNTHYIKLKYLVINTEGKIFPITINACYIKSKYLVINTEKLIHYNHVTQI